ncbi:MAG: metallophosphoesterase [Methylomonas sp.]
MYTNNNILRRTVVAASFSLFAAINTTTAFASDPVVLTFSTLGDSRQDPAAPDDSLVNAAQNLLGNSALTAANVNVPYCSSPSGSTGLVPNPGLSGQDCKWMQNTTAWARIIRTVQSQKSNLLFFNGDMIMGYGLADVPVTSRGAPTIGSQASQPADTETVASITASNTTNITSIINSDLMQFYKEYGFWRGMVANLMETGTYVVPVPGNHETQCKRCKALQANGSTSTGKSAVWQNENAWRDNMGDLILDTNRLNNLLSPTGLSLNSSTWPNTSLPGSADGVTTSQQQLTYSFDIGTNHFAVINTDPAGNDGHAPTNWLNADLTAAVANGAKNLFVFGHKPAYYYYYAGANETNTGLTTSAASSLYLTDNTAGNAFWQVIKNHNATYFSGHEHVYNVSQPSDNFTPQGGAPNGSYQFILGAGGSPFDDLASAPGNSSASTPDPVGDATNATIVTSAGNTTISATALESDRMYSWATVSIHQSGAVTVNTYGFDPTVVCNPSLNSNCTAFNGQMVSPTKTLATITLPYSAQ